MKNPTIVAAFSAALVALIAAAPTAQAFWESDTHKHASAHKVSPYEKRYGQTFRRGFPENCAMLAERAHLTNNRYWHYAAARCRRSRYSYH